MKLVSKYHAQIYALNRIVIGFLFSLHGGQKLFGWFGGSKGELTGMVLAGGIIEFVGGVLIAIGFQTAFAAFICSGTMAVAYFMFHQPKGILPIQNHGELAAIYCWVFLLIAATGDGIWSLGSKRKG